MSTTDRERTSDLASWAAVNLMNLAAHIGCSWSVAGVLDELDRVRDQLDQIEERLREEDR